MKTIGGRFVQPLPKAQNVVVPVILWDQPAGMHTQVSNYRVDPNSAVSISNIAIRQGKLLARNGFELMPINTLWGGTLTTLVAFVRSNDTAILYGFTSTGLWHYNFTTTNWTQVSGVTFTSSSRVSYTAWGTKMIFCNGSDGIWEVDTYTQVATRIWDTLNAKHVTTFAGRIIASQIDTETSRIQWSVKNNNNDIVGIGSGFDDLLSTPGGYTDSVTAVMPVSDESAIIVRSRSCWLMSTTGNPDAPFRFSRIFAEIGSTMRHAIVNIPGAVIMPSTTGVYLVTPSDFKDISEKVRYDLITSLRDDPNVIGLYDHFEYEYRLVGYTQGTLFSRVWRYNLPANAWTYDTFADEIRSMTYMVREISSSLTIDSLSGTIDNLAGSIDMLGATTLTNPRGLILGMDTDSVFMESINTATDAGSVSTGGSQISSGIIYGSTPYERTSLVQIQVEVVSTGAVSVWAYYSDDDGASWNTYSQPQTVTSGRQIIRFTQTVDRQGIQIRIATPNAYRYMRIISVIAYVQPSSMVNP